MNIFRYGISLISLGAEHIEHVRKARNSTGIIQYMEYKEEITPEMQLNWFRNLKPGQDFYFIIECNSEKAGMIHVNSINYEESSCHSGLFIWNESYLNTHIPVLASLALLEVFILIFGMESVYAKVKKDNEAAIKYNTSLGFKLIEGEQGKEFGLYQLQKNDFIIKSERLRSNAARIAEAASRIVITEEEINQIEVISKGSFRKNAEAHGVGVEIS